MAQTVISRGFGLLQRIITRGFFSSAAPSPDCYEAFNGTITDRIGLEGVITGSVGFQGAINDSVTAFIGTIYPVARFEGAIDSTGISVVGAITDTIGFEGCVCDCE